MLELPHTLVGAAIAAKIPNPIFSIPLAFLSHFLVDLIPHWNPSLYTETEKYGRPGPKSTKIVIFDIIFSLLAGFTVAARFWPDSKRAFFILLASFAAVLPDVVEGFYFFLGVRIRPLKNLVDFQRRHQTRTTLEPGLLIQGAVVIMAFFIGLF